MPKKTAFMPVPTANRKAVLDYVTELARTKRVVFVGTNSEYIYKAEEGDFKFVFSRSKTGTYCLAVYSNDPAMFIRSSGGIFSMAMAELWAIIRHHEEDVTAPGLLRSLKQQFGA